MWRYDSLGAKSGGSSQQFINVTLRAKTENWNSLYLSDKKTVIQEDSGVGIVLLVAGAGCQGAHLSSSPELG